MIAQQFDLSSSHPSSSLLCDALMFFLIKLHDNCISLSIRIACILAFDIAIEFLIDY
jgi:hypothetical protein